MDVRESKNLLLRQLPDETRDRLAPYFRYQNLDFKQTLLEARKPVTHLYFIENGVASMVTDLTEGEAIETGTVGNEGLVGLPAVLGARSAPGRVFCQIPGTAFRLPAELVAMERAQGSEWFQLLLRYANFVTAMSAQSAACNRMHSVDARMSRWLLMTHDRVAADDFPLTQEFLAMMLGVARPTVNIAGATLQKAGFIKYTRGRMSVLDRGGLETAACECYQRIREELDEMLHGHPGMGKDART